MDLAQYPRPNVAVDIAVLTVMPGQAPGAPGTLAVLLHGSSRGAQGRALPGRFLREGQTIAQSVSDVLEIKAGLREVRAEARLLRVFDDPQRDPRGWTLSLAHSLTLASTLLAEATGTLVGITTAGGLETGESLRFDHDVIVEEAAVAIRDRYEQRPDPDGILDQAFTMAELRSTHQSVIGGGLLKDTFRRRMEPYLEPVTGPGGAPILRSDGGRPAQVYKRTATAPTPGTVNRRLRLPRAGVTSLVVPCKVTQ